MIRDWLIPLGLDDNHGYAKAPVVNSEVSKKREALEKRLSNVQRFREAARIKAHRASILSTRLRKEAKEHGERLYRGLNERVMHELDNRKDHIMTVCKLALANLAMWVRDRFFPATYAHATWHRLLPFFQLPGRVQWGSDVVQVEVRPFNNRQLTRDLLTVCQRVNALRPRLPDGRGLILHASSSPFG